MLKRLLVVTVSLFNLVGLAQSFNVEDTNKLIMLLKGDEKNPGTCISCHSMTYEQIHEWKGATLKGLNCLNEIFDTSSGFEPRDYTKKQALDALKCLKVDDALADEYDINKHGFISGYVNDDLFKNIFITAFEDEYLSEYKKYLKKISMPIGSKTNAYSPKDFNLLLKWNQEQLPYLEQFIPQSDYPVTCDNFTTNALQEYLTEISQDNWGIRNSLNGVKMFGCDDNNSKNCFNQKNKNNEDIFPLHTEISYATNWSNGDPNLKFRFLSPVSTTTSYWVRSSADGRYFASGKSNGAFVADLMPRLSGNFDSKYFHVNAAYDPSFMPNNSGFLFQSPTIYCSQSILLDPNLTTINTQTPGCQSISGIALYQTMSSSLFNDDYDAIAGGFTSDGGTSSSFDRAPNFGSTSTIDVSLLKYNGQIYVNAERKRVSTPFMGDYMNSPSGGLLVGRTPGKRDNVVMQNSYKVQKIKRDDATGEINIKTLANLCLKGNKATFSYDERYIVYYHYVDKNDFTEFGFKSANDPEFTKLVGKSANIYLIDLKTATTKRITTMNENQYAIFPHFRSDGWLYFLVNDRTQNKRFMFATDVVL